MFRPLSLRMLGSFYERLEEVLLICLVVLMVSLGFLQILFRNLISIGIVWVDPLVRHLVLWIALLGASIATKENKHISIDILSGYLPPPLHRTVRGGVQLFSALICLLLVHPAIRFLQIDYQAGKTLALGIPMWVSQAIMPVMMLVLGIRFILQGTRNLASGKRGKKT
jgi:TRAP-type C4-dicarboxylate transport system permease small subunit